MTPPVAVTVSDVVRALECPRLFVLERLRGLRGRAGRAGGAGGDRSGTGDRPGGSPGRAADFEGSFSLGRTVHRLAADWSKAMLNPPPELARAFGEGPGPFADAVRQHAYEHLFWPWFEQHWPKVASSEQVERLWETLEQVVGYLGGLLLNRRSSGTEQELERAARKTLLGVEQPLSSTVATPSGRPVRLVGTADLVAGLPGGQVAVIDLKTRPQPHDPTDLLQVALYARLLESAGVAGAQPVLVYFTPEPQHRAFEPKAVREALDGHLGPFLDELLAWLSFRPGRDPAPPPTRLEGLCDGCPYHPPCPQRFPLADASASRRAAPDAGSHPAGAVPGSALPVEPSAVQQALADLGLQARVAAVDLGPAFVCYRLEPEGSATMVERVRRRSEDLKVRLGLSQEPVVRSAPGFIAFEVARPRPERVDLRELLERPEVRQETRPLKVPLGVGVGGRVQLLDLTDPNTCHLLVGGSTGSGKSVLLMSLVFSLAYRYGPEEVGLYLVDPKMLSFLPFRRYPHLRRAPVTETGAALGVVQELAEEMDTRYRRLAGSLAADIDQLNGRAERAVMAHLVAVFDEFADLVLTRDRKARETFHEAVARIGQKGRAAGIHLILATQRPDKQVVAGLIKSNLQARVALKVPDRVSSQVVIDRPGAQGLAGRGDMLFSVGSGEPVRLQAPYIGADEIEAYGATLAPPASGRHEPPAGGTAGGDGRSA